MSRKSKKKQAEEQIQAQSAIEPDSEPAPPAPDSEPTPEPVQAPSQEQQPLEVLATPESSATSPAVTPIADDELPPPPADLAETTKKFPPIKTRKPGASAALRRAGAIFGKDARTIAKHGLISSVILLVFLMVMFYIASYAMFMFVSTDLGGKGNGGDGNNTGDGHA